MKQKTIIKDFYPGDKSISPTLQTWRKWIKTGKAKPIQLRGFYKGEFYPSLYEIKGKIYKDANDVAPTYSFRLAPAEYNELCPELKHLYKIV